MEKYKLITLNKNSDARGSLIALENNKNIPFDIQRVFYIFDVFSQANRGAHANKKSEFLFIAISGSCQIQIKDGVSLEKTFLLDSPTKALYIDKMIWKEMFDFTSGTVLLVFSNHTYDADEYIRNYSEFINIKEILYENFIKKN